MPHAYGPVAERRRGGCRGPHRPPVRRRHRGPGARPPLGRGRPPTQRGARLLRLRRSAVRFARSAPPGDGSGPSGALVTLGIARAVLARRRAGARPQISRTLFALTALAYAAQVAAGQEVVANAGRAWAENDLCRRHGPFGRRHPAKLGTIRHKPRRLRPPGPRRAPERHARRRRPGTAERRLKAPSRAYASGSSPPGPSGAPSGAPSAVGCGPNRRWASAALMRTSRGFDGPSGGPTKPLSLSASMSRPARE